MKKIFSYITFLSVSLWAFTSCKKMDSNYRDFIVPGGIVYTGKPILAMVAPGNKRVKLSWYRGADPSIVKARVFWNNYTDSVEVNIPEGSFSVSVMINDLPENNYSFFIKTYDAKGNSSVPLEVIGAVYGENYQQSLLNRIVDKSIMSDEGITTITWGGADVSNGAFATEVKYTDTNGQEKSVIFPVSETSSVINDMDGNATSYQYRTLFVPDTLAIDTFYTAYETHRVVGPIKHLSRAGWTITSDAVLRAGYGAENVIDNDPDTYWWTMTGSPTPYSLTVDMGAEKTPIDGIYIQQSTRTDPRPQNFEVQVSSDGTTWRSLGSFEAADNTDVQNFNFLNSESFRYFKINCTTIYRGKANCSLAEVGVYYR